MYFTRTISELRPVQKFSWIHHRKQASVFWFSQFQFFLFSQAHQSEGMGHTGHSSAYIYREGNTKVARAALCIHWDHIWAACFSSTKSSVADLFLRAAQHTLSLIHSLDFYLSYLLSGPPFTFGAGFLNFGVSCAALRVVGQCWTGFARSIRFHFYPILKPSASTSSGPVPGSDRTFSFSGRWRFA
jgi:hypothetical protein